MTTILKLPEEILRKIFQELPSSDLRQCQKTCRSWYFPAHITLLREMSFWGALEIKRFVTSIDHNPDDSYLKAVKTISILGVDSSDPQFDKDFVQKLFFRFKNIRKVYAYKSLPLFENVNDSEEFSRVWPKLETFEITASYKNRAQYFEVAWKLRRCLTLLEIMEKKLMEKYGDTAQFISSFPRLKSIAGLDSFGELLPAFEHLEQFTTIRITPSQDKQNFAEKFLASKAKDVQDTIVQRLSQVLHLECRGQEQFCVHSTKFVNKYLTGLETYILSIYDNKDWKEAEEEAFCNDLLDIVCSAKKADIYLQGISMRRLSNCFPIILNKVFNKDASTRRILTFELSDNLYGADLANLRIESDQCVRKIRVAISDQLTIHNIISNVLDQITITDNVDEFILKVDNRGFVDYNDREVNTDTYDALLGKMPSLKQVTLDIPFSFKDRDPTSTNVYPLVDTLTWRPTQSQLMTKLLRRCSWGYPSLKRLSLPYYGGCWDDYYGVSKVDLSNFTLDKLELDVTYMRRMKDCRNTTMDFFVVRVETEDGLYLYKISPDISSSSITNEEELSGLTLGKNYIQLHIIIDSLEYLEIRALVDYNFEREGFTINDCLDFPDFTERIEITLNAS